MPPIAPVDSALPDPADEVFVGPLDDVLDCVDGLWVRVVVDGA
jgi:hypothetical protein